MENKRNKCSFKDHKDIDAISFCQKCKSFMCNKCIAHHNGLFDDHNQFSLEKIQKIFSLDFVMKRNILMN